MGKLFRYPYRFFFAFSFCFTLLHAEHSVAADAKYAKHNGTAWFELGPAVITSCKRIEIHDRGMEYRRLTGEKNFETAKSLLISLFDRRLNLSPVAPEYRNVSWPILVTLFSDVHGSRDDVLIKIPFTAKILGKSEEETNQKLRELEELAQKIK